MAKAKRPSSSTARPSAVRQSTADAVTTPTGAPQEDYQSVFGKSTFYWIGGGLVLMLLGMLLMAGGAMPDPDTWDESLIYSFRRITLAPFVILAGLGVITYAIFKK